MTTTPSLFSYEEDCMILCSGMTFRELADYMFVPIEYVRKRHAHLVDPPMPKPLPLPRVRRHRKYRTWHPEDVEAARTMRSEGLTLVEIGQVFGCGKPAIRSVLRHREGKKC